jgi:ApaG protein
VHTYSSGTVIKTPVGTMQGTYGMLSNGKDAFDATIPVFRLAVPEMLN